MSWKYLGFVLLVWLPGVRCAQSCNAPYLDHGFYGPKQATYPDGTVLSFGCVKGHKPAREGWWGTSTCQKGNWSPKPRCIDNKACIALEIPNGHYTRNEEDWYDDGESVRINCEEGYKSIDFKAVARCVEGEWTSVPDCERDSDACGEPPRIPNAVVIGQEYREVYTADSRVEYECKGGYTIEWPDESNRWIFCISGNWTQGPTCSRSCVMQRDWMRIGETHIYNEIDETLSNGEKRIVTCNQQGYTTTIQCIDGKIAHARCCDDRGYCY